MKNPVDLNGIDFIEYASPSTEKLKALFSRLGFEEVAHHRSKAVSLFQQGQCRFVINSETGHFSEEFFKLHGPGVCALGFRVNDAKQAQEWALQQGAKAPGGEGHSFPAIYGVGGSLIYFVDKDSHFQENFQFIKTPSVSSALLFVDHLTHNVSQGDMEVWCDFYERIFNFTERRYFDIKGAQTGLVSKVMRSPCNTITIPINEPAPNELGEKSQIQEFLNEYKGAGIQHIALNTRDIISVVSDLRKKEMRFLDVPDTYYEELKNRIPLVKEDIGQLRENQILADGDAEGYLLQIFTQNAIGPVFYEIIQREGHEGFGEGNFQALFDAIERDQMKRGYLK
ncbi:MAG: 4-hydroxyphenylpyruvate dioxygenase [Bdellovibrionales bacterium]|nr:4-hydroxyphenylpyruvate dioxygenase [Bdellovibrionales bacterium]